MELEKTEEVDFNFLREREAILKILIKNGREDDLGFCLAAREKWLIEIEDIKNRHPSESVINTVRFVVTEKVFNKLELRAEEIIEKISNLENSINPNSQSDSEVELGKDETMFGMIAIEKITKITKKDVLEVLKKQKQTKEKKIKIATRLVQKGKLSPVQAATILKIQKERRKEKKSEENYDIVALSESIVGEIGELEILKISAGISENKMSAILKVEKLSHFPSLVTPQHIKDLLLNNFGVTDGFVSDRKIQVFIDKVKKMKKLGEEFIIARGVEPKEAEEEKIESEFSDFFESGTIVKNLGGQKNGEKENITETIDWKKTKKRPIVNEEDIIAELIPARAGKSGINIFGEEIMTPEGEKLPFDVDEKTAYIRTNERGNLEIVSLITGMPECKDGIYSVSNTIIIKEDLTRENINFENVKGCNVRVIGDVKGVSIKCNNFRAISVDDETTIEAAWNALIDGGIRGSKTKVKAGKLLKAAFITSCKNVEADVVHIKTEMTNAKVKCREFMSGNGLKVRTKSVIEASEFINIHGPFGQEEGDVCELIIHNPKLSSYIEGIDKLNKIISREIKRLNKINNTILPSIGKGFDVGTLDTEKLKLNKFISKKERELNELILNIQEITMKRNNPVVKCSSIIQRGTKIVGENSYIKDEKGNFNQLKTLEFSEALLPGSKIFNRLIFNAAEGTLKSEIVIEH